MEVTKVPRHARPVGKNYKWVALTNTTLGVLMGAMNSSILLISLPAIFKGLNVNPLEPGETTYLLWILMGYMVVTATLLVTIGRLSDIWGRVRIYNAGFVIFTVASILLFLTPSSGNDGALEIIIFRLVQGLGGGCLIANSSAIITDAFPARQRGFALGLNMVAALGGSLVGLLVGGVLATVGWRYVFLVSVPFGIIGTVWAYLSLREQATKRAVKSLDLLGNFCLGGGLVIFLVAMTYGIMPYGGATTGWGNPWVIAGLVIGLVLLALFVWVESRVKEPLFNLHLFQIRSFATGCAAQFLSALAYGGLQFMLIVWLQGVWLPLHGYKYEDTPLWSAIYLIPLLVGFMIFGVAGGWLSDRIGVRVLDNRRYAGPYPGLCAADLLSSRFQLSAFRHSFVPDWRVFRDFFRTQHGGYYERATDRVSGRRFGNASDLPKCGQSFEFRRIFHHYCVRFEQHSTSRYPERLDARRCSGTGGGGSFTSATNGRTFRGLPGLQPNGKLDTRPRCCNN